MPISALLTPSVVDFKLPTWYCGAVYNMLLHWGITVPH